MKDFTRHGFSQLPAGGIFLLLFYRQSSIVPGIDNLRRTKQSYGLRNNSSGKPRTKTT